MKSTRLRFNPRAFTLLEMLVVITIISLLAALTMGGYTYAMNSSKRRITTGTFEAIKLSLERYNSEFGEYPEASGDAQMVEILPGKSYDTSGAACLYQALTGDGFDQIKGASASATSDESSAQSDGKTEGTAEIRKMMLVEVPRTIWTVKNSRYIIIDGFGRPFQYIKAATPETVGETPEATTINSTYDLWSYSEDEVNTTLKSIDTLDKAQASVKWVKNW
ncbi:prepilin-type N-terminal cleavage/methylation domain-containing protein [Prosthecobacter sp.]|uniref:type II secretion system protein n=1 Tax=Prosthecobacter sp. TaxID=1965333 RepID=UPI002AB9341B|nr:prepilin-type N-terminal cleavage/methylation domain-containing protein [Prosthecobacter sp.]MDZ4403482.1 prepilin-type N-terminal cleavage/methylation domain-containing protein [Prosthecobacter sp.]